jgi:putative photosynthetic complex assembly protein
MKQGQANTVPKGALVIAGGLTLMVMAMTAAVRVTGTPPSAKPAAVRAAEKTAPIASRTLRFADTPEGAVLITDARTGAMVHTITPGGQTGFVRGVMRGFARDRRMRGIDSSPGFTLTSWQGGQLSLTDTATGREVELGAFGGSNRAEFAALLEPRT